MRLLGREKIPSVFRRQGFDIGSHDPRRLGQCSDIPKHEPVLDGPVERNAENCTEILTAAG
jgi:hypothetical protein